MTAPNRVDDLRKRYHENPRRFFAPLANEYRKTGFIDRAILLCEKHLFEQPGNMNGLVVYGQCLFETGRLDEARAPFESALEVDPENLIALRHLGDIARLGGDDATARKWYERVLEFDRRNDEVIALLAEVGGAAEKPRESAASLAPNIVSVAPSVSVAGGVDALGMIDLEPTAPAPPVVPPAPVRTPARGAASVAPVDPSAKTVEVSAQPKPLRRASLLDIDFDFGEVAAEPAPSPTPARALLPAEAAEYGFAEIEIGGPTADDTIDTLLVEAVAEPESARPADAPAHRSLVEERHEEASLSSMAPVEGLQLAEFHVDVEPLAELESLEFAGGDAEPLEGLESKEFVAPPPEERLSFGSIAMDNLSTEDLASTPTSDLPLLSPFGEDEAEPRHSSPTAGIPLLPPLEDADTLVVDVNAVRSRLETPATFVTETMAELYVQQGLTDKAIDVYRQLITQSPHDEGLKQRLHALETPAAPEPFELEPLAAETVAAETVAMEPRAVETAAAAVDEFPEFDMGSFAAPATPVEVEESRTPAPAPAPRLTAPRLTAPRVTLDFETPTEGDLTVEPAPPANAMLSEMSFADVALSTPTDAPRPSVPTPPAVAVAVPVHTGPSAREFFSAFARRALTPVSTAAVSAVPSAAGGPPSPLDTIFGTAVDADDESAAHRLAAIGATSGPSGGTGLDSLFGEGPSAPMPPEGPSALGRSNVARASNNLRFDQFFASSVPSATPSATPSTPTEVPAPEPAPTSEQMDADSEAPGEDDDLDQFQGWLRGLTQ